MFIFWYQGQKQSRHRTFKNAVLAAHGCNEKFIKITDKNGKDLDFLEDFSKIEKMGADFYKLIDEGTQFKLFRG